MTRLASIVVIAALATLAPADAAAQHGDDSGQDGHRSHRTTFSTGTREHWTFSTPHLDINGGLFYVNTSPATTREAFLRLHAQ
ncbi:MAG: hypothetical protein ACRDGN_07030, partial [bacterium]